MELIKLPEDSPEGDCLISTADRIVHGSNGNACVLGIQIGVVTGPCIADCGFCSFAASTTNADDFVMSGKELEAIVRHATQYGDVSVISLMTIHNFDFDDLMDAVRTVKGNVPDTVKIAVNTGDLSQEECMALSRAGVSRAYHSIRLDEGDVTLLNPLDRSITVRNLGNAGLKVIGCVEPIGPEHTPEYIVRKYYDAFDEGYDECSAAKRIAVPGTRLYGSGEISDRRLQQIRSVLYLSDAGRYGGFYGGLDHAYAEYAGSPKDNADYSERSLGRSMEKVRKEMFDSGYRHIIGPDGSRIRLDEDYLRRTGSL